MPERATVTAIRRGTSAYPNLLSDRLGLQAPELIWVLGNPEPLSQRLVALFCSIRCPGDEILKLYDVARGLRDAGVGVISGFHTPMEKECLVTLLRGQQPIVFCPARSLHRMRIPAEWRDSLDQGRLVIVSAFDTQVTRATKETAKARNRLVAALASNVLIAYAEPGGQTAELAADLAKAGRPAWTLDSPELATTSG